MNTVFLDTGYLIALEVLDDQYHEAAAVHWSNLLHDMPLVVTTSYVLDEVVTFFNSRNLHSKAVETGENILNSPSIRFVHIDESLFQEGWTYFKKHADKSYSFTDCISFIVMNRLGIVTAITFDEHFKQAGYNTPLL